MKISKKMVRKNKLGGTNMSNYLNELGKLSVESESRSVHGDQWCSLHDHCIL